MITVSGAVSQIIKNKPFIEEGLSQGLLNLSALARLILPEVRRLTYKDIKEGAILMALKRHPKTIKSTPLVKNVLSKSGNLIVRSNLSEFTVSNVDFSLEKHQKIIEEVEKTRKYFLTVTQGTFETTVIVASELKEIAETILGKDKIIFKLDGLSSITINLPGKTVLTPGVYYSILKILAWEGINIVEVVSTFSEFIIVLEEKEVSRAFTLLKDSLTK